MPSTIDSPIIDRKDWAAVQQLIAEFQAKERIAEQSAVAILIGGIIDMVLTPS